MDSVKANVFNVKRLVYTNVLKDDASGYQHGPVKKLAEPMQVQLAIQYAEGEVYGGGIKQDHVIKIIGAGLKLDANKVPIEVRADILGHKYENGELITSYDDQPKDIAVGYEMESTGDNQEFVWLFKGKTKPFGKNVEQISGPNIKIATDSIDIGFSPRIYDKKIKHDADTANPSFTKVNAATYLDTVPGGELVQEV